MSKLSEKSRKRKKKSDRIKKKIDETLLKDWIWNGAKVCESCRSRKMLKNAYLDANIGVDTAENGPLKE